VTSVLGANHRGHDILVVDGQEQWLIGKFAYGVTDKDLVGEEVDVFVERGCAGSWERLGTAVTTRKGEHVPVDGVWDTGGRVYFAIPRDKALPIGRHRVRFVVAGDHTHADLFVDVAAPAAPIFVSDVDGTLTSSESAEVLKLFTGGLPRAQPGAAAALSALAAKGYRPVYLTARPEWLLDRTRAFLAANGFPPGVIRTTTGVMGISGKRAAAFKSAELAALRTKGFTIGWAFGNRPSDAEAYEAAAIAPPDHRVFLRLDDPHGGRRIEQYRDLVSAVASAPPVCTSPGNVQTAGP
jgi:hypothetical protein